MNTSAHVLTNLLVQGRGVSNAVVLAIVAGALVPDMVMIGFYAYEKLLLGTPEMTIWSERYFLPEWQAIFDSFHSIPLAAIGCVIGWLAGNRVISALFLSMMLHALLDLPVHHDDAHRHFYPFSNWKFESPVSYWDSRHYGDWFLIFEFSLVVFSSLFLIFRYPSVLLRVVALVAACVYFVFLGYAFFIWG